MLSSIFNRGPVVSSGSVALVRMADISGLGRQEAVSFTHDVTWFLDSTARLEFRHGGVVVATLEQFSDSGRRFLSSLAQACKAAARAAERYAVDGASTAEIAVCARLSKVPGLPNVRRDTTFCPDYHKPPDGWWVDTPATRGWAGDSTGRRVEGPTRLRPLDLFVGDVWKSGQGLCPGGLEGLRRAVGDALGDSGQVPEILALGGGMDAPEPPEASIGRP